MASNKGTRSRPHWKTAALGTALGAGLVGAVLLTNALAVNQSPFPFELDGNVTNSNGVFGPPASGDGKDDWQNVFNLSSVTPPGTGAPAPSGAEVFIRDLPGETGKETQYDAGKDTLDLNGWTRKEVSKVVPDKDNITNAYAKQYMIDHDGNAATPEHRVIYFGADRLANNGDAALGFWFFQQKVELTGTNGFSPNHTARNVSTGQRGDVLVQVDFVSGGKSSEIQIFEWVGSGGSHGPLDELEFKASNGTIVCTDDDAACAITNDSATGSYWPYTPKFGTSGTFPAESFYEGGIDISELVGDVCFNSFLANTRTSHSETADLKDLALGDFNTCGSIDLVRKVCQADTGRASPSYDPATELYTTQHEITILNDGLGGNVYDVAIRDDSVGSNNICSIVAISGGTGNPVIPAGGILIPDNTTYIQVADTLAAGVANQMAVTLLCESPLPKFLNTASVRAGQVDGGTSLTDSYEEVDADFVPQCVKTVNSNLAVTKSCPQTTPVFLDPENGYKPKVCVDISIENTGEDRVDVTAFDDIRMDGTSVSYLEKIPFGTTAGHTDHRVLEPGAAHKINFTECYYPAAPDEGQTDPNLATYSDKVKASGRGHANPSVLFDSNEASASCDLCPAP